MSLQTAMEALNAATPNSTPEVAPTMPTNMSNSGANITNENVQASQEIKETGDNSSQKDKTDGVVDATKSAAEATTTALAEETKKEEPISAKFSALAKKEKAIIKLQQDIKTKEADIAAKEAALAEREAKSKQADALWETDIFAALEARGYTYQKLTDMILSGKSAPEKAPEDPITVAKKMTEDLRNEFLAKEKAATDAAAKAKADKEAADAKALEEAYNAYREEIATYINTNNKEYKLTKLYAQEEMVVETVKEYYEKHKRVLSVKEASDLVENYLRDEVKKAREALEEGEPKIQTTKKEAALPEEAKAVTKTLSNNLTPTTSPQTKAATEAERMKRALARLNS